MKEAPGGLSHVGPDGAARMVDVSQKPVTERAAKARGFLSLGADTIERVFSGRLPKGDALATARIAGVMAAKQTSSVIPLCHPLHLTFVDVTLERGEGGVVIGSEVRCSERTGAEMEALHAVAVAGLTLYDMVKAVEKTARLERVELVFKSGGKSGVFEREKG